MAAFHWARKLVFTSFPVGNIVPLSRKLFSKLKLGILHAPQLPTRKYELGNTSLRAQWNAAYITILLEISTKLKHFPTSTLYRPKY